VSNRQPLGGEGVKPRKLEDEYLRLAEEWKSREVVFRKLTSGYWRPYMSERANPKPHSRALS